MNLRERDQNTGHLWTGMGRKRKEVSEGDGNVLYHDWVGVIQPYASVKIHQTVILKICALHSMTFIAI